MQREREPALKRWRAQPVRPDVVGLLGPVHGGTDVCAEIFPRRRRTGPGTGRAMLPSSWASPQNLSCAGQRPASCAASALAIGLTDTTPTRNCYACGTG